MSLTQRLTALVDKANQKTGHQDKTLSAAVTTLCNGYGTGGGGGGGNPEPLTVYGPGVYTNESGFSPVTVNEIYIHSVPQHCDENGIWHCPEDWDDVETIPLPNDETTQILYLVYRTDVGQSWISYGINAGAYKYTKGHAVDGEFVPTSTTVNKNSGTYIQEVLTDDYETSGKHTIVIKIEPQTSTTSLTGTRGTNYTFNGAAHTASYQPLVMRYGQLPKATQIGQTGYFLQSDNIRNCKSLTSCNTLYGTCCYSLCRHRHTGWDTKNVTSFNNMFGVCRSLIDCDMDFSNWVTSKCTSIASMFNQCNLLRGAIDCTGWDTQNITSIANMFSCCYNITAIKGIEGWNLSKCNTFNSSPFYYMYSLYQNNEGILDLSNWRVGQASTASTITFANMFTYVKNIRKLNISGWNLSKITSFSYAFANMSSLQQIDMTGITPPAGGLLTTMAYMFSECKCLKRIITDNGLLNGWDLSNVTAIGSMFNVCQCIEQINVGTPSAMMAKGSTSSNIFNSFITYCFALKKADMSFINAGMFTGSWGTPINYAYNLQELKPMKNITKALNFSSFYRLNKESLLAIIENLATVSSATTLTLGAVLKAKLTSEQIAVATQKGWTIA